MKKNILSIALVSVLLTMIGAQFAFADSTRATAPNAGEITTAVMNGMDETVEVKNSFDVTETGEDAGAVHASTPIGLFNTDLTPAQQKAKFQQSIVIHNLATSGTLCVFAITDHTAGSCAAATASCLADGQTNKAMIVTAGKSRSIRLGGDVRPCMVATTGGIAWQAERYLTMGK